MKGKAWNGKEEIKYQYAYKGGYNSAEIACSDDGSNQNAKNIDSNNICLSNSEGIEKITDQGCSQLHQDTLCNIPHRYGSGHFYFRRGIAAFGIGIGNNVNIQLRSAMIRRSVKVGLLNMLFLVAILRPMTILETPESLANSAI